MLLVPSLTPVHMESDFVCLARSLEVVLEHHRGLYFDLVARTSFEVAYQAFIGQHFFQS